MTTNAHSATGGSSSAEILIKAAHAVLDRAGVHMSPSRVSRTVRQYRHQVEPNGLPFLHYLATAFGLSERQRRGVLADPELARVIAYADPTGETAVNNVLRDKKKAAPVSPAAPTAGGDRPTNHHQSERS